MRKPIWFFLVFFLSSMGFSQWKLQQTVLKVEFRGLSAVNGKVAWASGSRNTYARTTNGGETWEVATLADKEVLDFRDVEAVDANTAYLLSIGTGTKSRIYKTTDPGNTGLRRLSIRIRRPFWMRSRFGMPAMALRWAIQSMADF